MSFVGSVVTLYALISFAFGDTIVKVNNASTDRFQYKLQLFRNRSYSVKTANQYFKNIDTLPYAITVIPDQYPLISIDEKQSVMLMFYILVKAAKFFPLNNSKYCVHTI